MKADGDKTIGGEKVIWLILFIANAICMAVPPYGAVNAFNMLAALVCLYHLAQEEEKEIK